MRHRPQQRSVADYVQVVIDAHTNQQKRAQRRKKNKTRQQQQIEQTELQENTEQDIANERLSNVDTNHNEESQTVMAHNMADHGELENPDEYDDPASGLHKEFQQLREVKSLAMSRTTGVFIGAYATHESGLAAVQEKHDKLYEGHRVVAMLNLPVRGGAEMIVSQAEKNPRASQHETTLLSSHAMVKKSKKKRRSKIKNAVIRDREKRQGESVNIIYGCKFRVRNLVDPDELEDDDEYEDVLAETTTQFAEFGAITSLVLVRFHDGEDAAGDVIVEYRQSECAVAGFNAFNGKTFGGRQVECSWYQQSADTAVVVQNMLSPDKLEGSAEYHDIEEVAEHFSQFGLIQRPEIERTTEDASMQYENTKESSNAVCQSNRIPYGCHTDEVELESNVNANNGGGKRPDGVCQRFIQPFETSFTDVVIAFLKRLTNLQERAHQQAPLHDKRSRRLVLGMHEVKRGLHSRKIRLLIIGTDVEQCGILDDKMAELVRIALAQEIPVIYPITRYFRIQ